jgi:HTH-type transcriptional regulator / antitoxin HigA
MARIAPIRTDADHAAALARIDALMDAEAGTPEADELAVLAELVEAYEAQRFPVGLPSPVEAIHFRMEQQGLEPRDLEPFIGSRGKVSEVLSGKTSLTLRMIRALHRHLGIPAEVLLQDENCRADESDPDDPRLDWKLFPLAEMAKRGWIRWAARMRETAEELLRDFVAAAGGIHAIPQPLFRRTDAIRQNAKTDAYALMAWTMKVLAAARATELPADYKPGTVSPAFMTEMAKLSVHEDGPRQAMRRLGEAGIHLVWVPHLRRTYLDGAALRVAETGAPVIGMTLRYDRIDNFWFCLLHELAHIGWHFDSHDEAFIDDLSLRDVASRNEDPREAEADDLAEEALIPEQAWRAANLLSRPSYARVISFAQQIGVHPGIVAGRIRYEKKNYRIFSPLVGIWEVSKHLPSLG